jgi:hypothetical protein
METSAIHRSYMATNFKGTQKPSLVLLIEEIREENPRIGASGAMQRAAEIVRAWAVANGYAE